MEAKTMERTAKVLTVVLCGMLAICLAFVGAQPAHAASAKKPAKAAIASVTSPSASKMTVKVKKAKRAKGYQYRISTNKKSTKGVKVKTTTKRTASFSGLAAGKKYYVKVRAYSKAGKKKVYGSWSVVKAVTVKKAGQVTGGDTGSTNNSSNSNSSGNTDNPNGSGKANTTTVTVQVANVKMRDFGSFNIVLYPEYAPVTVQNFIALASSGFYDGLTFHRMQAGFVLQGGDPNGNGSGGSAATIVGEFPLNGIANPLSLQFGRGVVAMARADDPNSASSQFLVTLASTDQTSSSLYGRYAAFGYVDSAGMQVVDNIASSCAAAATGNLGAIPDKANQPVIESIRVQPVTVTMPLAAA